MTHSPPYQPCYSTQNIAREILRGVVSLRGKLSAGVPIACKLSGGYEKFDEDVKSEYHAIAQWMTEGKGEILTSLTARHLSGKGGIKQALRDALSAMNSGKYRYVLRSDAKDYYKNIDHTVLLDILHSKTKDRRSD